MIKDTSTYQEYIKNNNTELTVFLVTYNRSDYLKLTIQSILKQTYKDFVLVILDNASTDNTQEVINSFTDNRIIYYRQPENVGGPANINTGISIALTPYYILFHDDDLMLPNFLEESLNTIKKYDFDILSTFAQHIDEKGNIQKYHRTLSNNTIEFTRTEYFKNFLNCSPNAIYCPSVMFKNTFIKEHNLYFDYDSAGPACDVLLWCEIERNNGKIGILPKELFQYRHHSQQDSLINNSYIQIQLISSFLSNIYYKKLLLEYNISFERFLIYAVTIELMLSYHISQNNIKLNEVLNSIYSLNSHYLRSKKLSLLLNLCKCCPKLTSNSLYYLKKFYSVLKRDLNTLPIINSLFYTFFKRN